MTSTRTRVERVLIHGDALDATRARLRLGSLLAGAELRPSGLPPAAVLCVRRLADPLPGTLRLDAAEVRAPPEWERACVAALERVLRSAARPAREAVPAGAEAVLFADRAELLACLARDARDGTAWTHWWWRELHAAAPAGADPVVAAWLETPEHVPAALELLAERGEAVRFVAGLPPAAATALAERVAAAFALPELRPHAVAAAAAVSAARGPDAPRTGAPPQPPWRRTVPETAQQQLAPVNELLLGVALALRRSPGVARSAAFATATRAWFAAVQEADPTSATADTAPTPSPAPRRLEPQQRTESPPPSSAPRLKPPLTPNEPAVQAHTPAATDGPIEVVPAPAPTGRLRPVPTSAPRVAAETRPCAREVAEGEPEIVRALPPVRPPASARPRAGANAPTSPARPRRVRDTDRPPTAAATRPPAVPHAPTQSPALVVDTALGGVFYLLNLALFLELYTDFTRPLEPGLPLSPWDLLALLGPKLLADRSRDDPLWPLLARLAGRPPRERPGADFRPPNAWRTPKSWLEPFEHDGPWRWSAACATLRLVHPAGFPVVAVPRRPEDPRAQLARELRRLRPLRPSLHRTSLRREPKQPLARWTSRLASYADARIRRALDLEPGTALDAVLLRRRARIFVTPTHVDVVLRLADLPLEVRYAGLDRTPGWIPAAGRYVALHFE